jgi:hypothetical protein
MGIASSIIWVVVGIIADRCDQFMAWLTSCIVD